MYKRWTEYEVQYLKMNWNKKRIQEIADNLGRTYDAVYTKAKTIGLGPNKKEYSRNWTKEEIDYLMDSWGVISIETIAKKLNRTTHAVSLKAGRLGLGRFLEAGEYITLNQLLNEIYGTYVGKQYTIKSWLEKGLPVKRKKVRNRSFKIIYLDDWWDWAEMNSSLVDFSKLEPLALGKEPKWVEAKRKADIENRRQFKKTPWTKAEDRLLKWMLDQFSYSYREMSLRLQRTEGAIKKRILDLGLKARPIKMPNHFPWTEEETELLIDLYNKGHCKNTISNYVNRSSQACGGKIERLIKEGILVPRSEFRRSC